MSGPEYVVVRTDWLIGLAEAADELAHAADSGDLAEKAAAIAQYGQVLGSWRDNIVAEAA